MLPKTMKAAVVRQFGKPLQIEEMPVKRPGNHQILVKVVASGVCHTDLHAAEGDWPVKPKSTARLEDINDVFTYMKAGVIQGRVVMKIADA